MISVTVTGIDDNVSFHDLDRMVRRYPDTEWGVLISVSRMGTPRYPSAAWLSDLNGWARTWSSQGINNLSAHLCGSIAREPTHAAIALALGPFQRAQINGYTAGAIEAWQKAMLNIPCRLILQARDEDSLQLVAVDARAAHADVLFDPSCGRGIEPFRWPVAPPSVRVGFAGGITPENVEDVVGAILAGSTREPCDFWIDMESGVRDDQDRFAVHRVATVLDKVAAINDRLRKTTGLERILT